MTDYCIDLNITSFTASVPKAFRLEELSNAFYRNVALKLNRYLKNYNYLPLTP